MAPIHDAIRAGDVEAVRRELAAGVSPDLLASGITQDLPFATPEWTPLFIATVYCKNYQSATALLETVSLLIEAGADVDAVCNLDRFRYTAIWFAAHSGRRKLVAALIAAGCQRRSTWEEDPSTAHSGLWNAVLMTAAIMAISCISFGSSCGLALHSRVRIERSGCGQVVLHTTPPPSTT